MTNENLSSLMSPGDPGSTFGGSPIAAAAILAVIETIEAESLLHNVRERESQIRDDCIVGPVRQIQGMGMLLGLVCDRPAKEVQAALLQHDILTGTSADKSVLRLLPPLILQPQHVNHLADALADIAPAT
jgi:acetylornithine aminotransferase